MVSLGGVWPATSDKMVCVKVGQLPQADADVAGMPEWFQPIQ